MPDRDPNTGLFVAAQPEGTTVLEPPKPDAAPPAPEKPPKKKGDSSGMEEMAARFLEGDYNKPPEVKPAAKAKEEPPKKEGEQPARKPKAKVKPVAPEPVTAPAPLTQAEIAQAAAEGVARAMKPDKKSDDSKPADLAPKHQRKAEVLDYLAKVSDEYKGLGDKYRASMRNLLAYVEKWKAEHPGEDYDDDDEQHADFLAANSKGVEWEDDDYTAAVAQMAAERAAASDPDRKRTREKLDEMDRQQWLAAQRPVIARETLLAAEQFWNTLGGAYKDVLLRDENGDLATDEDGNLTGEVNRKLLAQLMDKDPLMEAQVRAAGQLDAEVEELLKLHRGMVKLDAANPVHKAIVNFLDQIESEIMAKPEDEQLDQNGRRFLPEVEYTKRLKANKPATERQFWTFSFQDQRTLRAARVAKGVQQWIEGERKRIKDYAIKMGFAVPEEKPDDDEPQHAVNGNGKPVSPASTSVPKAAATRHGSGKEAETGVAAFINRGL